MEKNIKMSLKNFHMIFITISSLFMIYFAYWSYTHWFLYKDISYIVYLVLSIISFMLLLFYSRQVIKKFKGIIS